MIEKELFTVVEKTLSCGIAEDEKEIYENVNFFSLLCGVCHCGVLRVCLNFLMKYKFKLQEKRSPDLN